MKDQLNRDVHLNAVPKRIVSIVPSQTELLYDLGLDEEVVGITKFCIHPEKWFRTKARVGGTKKINIEIVKSLKPDIIFANKEENTKEDIEKLEAICPVWISDIHTFEDAVIMMTSVGNITGKEKKAASIITALQSKRKNFYYRTKIKALYLIWRNPYMAAGTDTFIHDMMCIAGFENIINEPRYPVLQAETMKNLNPKYILLSSEPYPFKQKHIDELWFFLPDAKIILVDGELFSWYGSRMLKSFDYFSALHEHIK